MILSKMVFPWAILTVSVSVYSVLWAYVYPEPFPIQEPYLLIPALLFYFEFLIYKRISFGYSSKPPEEWFQNSVKGVVFKIFFGITVFLVIILKGPEAHRKFILLYLFGFYLILTIVDTVLLYFGQNNRRKSA